MFENILFFVNIKQYIIQQIRYHIILANNVIIFEFKNKTKFSKQYLYVSRIF